LYYLQNSTNNMIDFEITTHLYKVATYYQLLGERRKAKAFKRAAMTLDGFGYFVQESIDKNSLMDLPGVGRSIAKAVNEIIETGKLTLEDELAANFPPFMAELAEVPKFGPRLLAKISQVECNSLYELEEKLNNTGVTLPSAASASLDEYIAVSNLKSNKFYGIPLPIALSVASEIQASLVDFKIQLVGEARMKCERVRSLDFITSQPDSKAIAKALSKTRFCLEQPSIEAGVVKAIIYPKLFCTIYSVPDTLKAFKLLNRSSPQSHIEELQLCAKNKGFEWNDDGIFLKAQNLVANVLSEADIYELIEVDYIPHEIRHIPLQEAKRIATKLVNRESIKGDYHTHTSSSDGIDDIERVLQKASSLNYKYLAITDHSHSLRVANGLSIGEVLRQHDKIEQMNSANNSTQLLKGIEVEIFTDGSLDYPSEVLKGFDIVIAAVHMNTRMAPRLMTERILRAIRNPNVHILAHPTGRLTSRPGNFFASRDKYNLDLNLILKECAKHHVALEVNAFPERLDLCPEDVQKALSHGAKIAIGSDAHAASHLSLVDCGLDVVRRAGCKSSDVLNTYNWDAAKKYLHSKPYEEIAIGNEQERVMGMGLHRASQRHNMTSLFSDLIEEKKVVVGIDLTASEKRDTGWAVLKGNKTETHRLGTDKDIIDATMEQLPDIVSIDSPLALPYGRCCEKTDCQCRQYGITRFCERFLMSLRIGVFPCLIPSMVNLTMRGIKLAKAFEEKGVSVIESYPGAAQDILGMPRKQRGIDLLCESLKRFGIDIKDANISHDELDAITSALVGYFYLSGQYLGLGDERENDLIIPSIPAFDVKSGRSKVIALAGETGSGKSTAALYLTLKYGLKYIRYSQVIAKLANFKGKYDKNALQKAGLQLHNELGQRKITLKLIDSLPENTHVVIDGVRWVEDLQTLQEHFGNRLKVLMIECPDKIISRRLLKSPFFMGKTEEDIKDILTHGVESEIITLGFHIPEIVSNKGSFKGFYEKLDTLVRNI